MKQYTTSEFREQLSGALDRAERGEAVIIARRGRRFRVVADAHSRPRARARAFFRVTDPRLLDAGWTWEWTPAGDHLRLRTKQRAKRSR